MPKSQFIDQKTVRAPGKIEMHDIPVNQYNKTFAESAKDYTKDELLILYHDMWMNREFENMISSVRATKEYNGIKYEYIGPAHLSIGMEAEAAGLAYTMEPEDYLIGAHRAHGETLLKAFWSIRKKPDDELMDIMKNSFPNILRVVEKYDKTGDVKEIAKDFFLYGFMCEIFGRDNGFMHGLGNAPHLLFKPFGIYPNNAIVGGSAGLSCGLALYKKVMQEPGIVVCSAGDGSLGCGPVWEAMNFAGMAQFKNLWPEPYKGNLPIIFNFQNNFYGMGGQTAEETMAFGQLARIGAGLGPNQYHTERVDGYNIFAVIDAHKRKREFVKNGDGPVILDIVTYRQCGHSTTDAMSYRTKEEVDCWAEVDSIKTFKEGLVKNQLASAAEADAQEENVRDRITRLMKLAIDDQVSPMYTLADDPDKLRKLIFSNQRIPKMREGTPITNQPKEENSRYQKLAKKVRFGIDEEGKPVSKMKVYSNRDAIFEAIFDKFYEDPSIIALGEDVRDWDGAFGVYGGMTEALPYQRLFNAPISEEQIVATAVGYAMAGGRAIPELMYTDFLGRAGDAVFNQLSKWQYMSIQEFKMPVVLRMANGNKYGPQHAQDWHSLCTHIPGLKVVYPVTPYDCLGLMRTAMNSSDPVIFFESQKLYDIGEMFHNGGVPTEYYEIPFGEPDVKRVGTDVTILTMGPGLYPAMDAAKILQEQYGVSAEVIDARSLVPFNYEPVVESIKKTGKIILATEATERGSFVNDMARNLTEFAFDYLDAPPVIVASPNVLSPFAYLDRHYFPQAHWFLDAINEQLIKLDGYTPSENYTTQEKIRRAKAGI